MQGAATSKLLPRSHWVSDTKCLNCYECRRPFSLLVRRHHCRMCGQVFCHRCSNYWLPGEHFSVSDNHIRLCKFCYRRETSQPSGSPKLSPIGAPSTPSRAPESSPRSEDEAIDEERNVRENNNSWSIFKENNQSHVAVSDIVWAPKASPTEVRASPGHASVRV